MTGGVIGGRIQLPVRVASEGDVELALTCFETRVTERHDQDGRSTERTHKVIWQRVGRPVVRVSGSRLSAQRSMAGIGLWSRTLRREDIGDVVSEIGITSKGGHRPQATCGLYAVPTARTGLAGSAAAQAGGEGSSIGPRVLVGVSLQGSSMTERARAELRKAIGH